MNDVIGFALMKLNWMWMRRLEKEQSINFLAG